LFSEIQNGVDRLKRRLYDMMQNEEIGMEIEEIIDQFVENRRNGYQYTIRN